MNRISKILQLDPPAIVLANPGMLSENTLLIRVVDISSAGVWFRSDASLSQGTQTQVTFQMKYGPGKRTHKVKFSSRVVRSEPGGCAIAFEYL